MKKKKLNELDYEKLEKAISFKLVKFAESIGKSTKDLLAYDMVKFNKWLKQQKKRKQK